MANLFRERFQGAISPLNCILKFMGVFICPSAGSQQKMRLINLWTALWLILCFLIQIHVLLNKTFYLKFVRGFRFPFREYVITFVNYSVSCTFDVIIHLQLLFTIRKTVADLLDILKPSDGQLERPNMKRIRLLSIAFIVWCFFTVIPKSPYRYLIRKS